MYIHSRFGRALAREWGSERKMLVSAVNEALMPPVRRFLRARCRRLPKERIVMSDQAVTVQAVPLPMRIDDVGGQGLLLYFIPKSGVLCTLWEGGPNSTVNGHHRALTPLFPETLMRFLLNESDVHFLLGMVDDDIRRLRRAIRRRRKAA